MRLLLLVPAVLLLAACAGNRPTGTSPATTSPTTTASTTAAQRSSTPTTKAGPPSVEVSRAPGGGAAVRPTAIMPVAPGTGPVVPVSRIDASAAQVVFGGTIRTDLSGTELQIQGLRGGCSTLTAALTTQTTKAVSVLLTQSANPITNSVTTPTNSYVGCSAVAATTRLTVKLAQPLGARFVILTQRFR